MLPITSSSGEFKFPPTGTARAAIVWTKYRQVKPFNLPLPYDKWHSTVTDGHWDARAAWQPHQGIAARAQDFIGTVPKGDPVDSYYRGKLSDAINSAIVRFDRAKGDASALLVAAAEIRQSASMIQGRTTQLYRGFKALKSLRFYDAAKAFNLVKDRKPKARRVGKNRKLRWVKHPIAGKYYPRPADASLTRQTAQSFSALCLEYNFGWAPLIGDIQTSVTALERDIAYEYPLQGYARVNVSYTDAPYTPGYETLTVDSTRMSVLIGATWTVTNPNYELSRRLGFVDLAVAAIELVPFSFVVNWVLNLNEWVGQLSTRYDPNLKDPYQSYKFVSVATRRSKPDWNPSAPVEVNASTARSFKRVVGEIPAVSLRVRQRWFTSFTRAANASSLLVTLFTKKERPSFLRI